MMKWKDKAIEWAELVEEKYLWKVLVALQILLIAVFGFWANESALDEDVAKLFFHVSKFCEEGFLFGDWTFVTTLEIDTSAIFAIPFYLIFRNIYFAFDVANLLWVVVYAYIVYDVTRRLNIPSKFRWMTILLFLIPYGVGMLDYFNMLFFNGGQYVIKAILPIMLMDLLLVKEPKVKEWVLFGCYTALLLLTSICSGMYVFICGLFPLVVIEFFRLYILRKGNFNAWNLSIIFSTFGLVVLGVLISHLLPGSPKGNALHLVQGERFFDYAFECIVGIFTLFSATVNDNVLILSVNGACVLIMFGFAATLLVLLLREVKNIKTTKTPYMIFGIFGWNLFILLASFTKYGGAFAHRYHIIGAFALFILAGLIYSGVNKIPHERLRGFTRVAVTGYLVLVMAVSNYGAFMTIREDKTKAERNLVEEIELLNAKTVFIVNNSGLTEILRLLDYNGHTEILDVTANGMIYGNYDYYQHVNDASYYTNNQEHYLLFKYKAQIEDFPEYLQKFYTYEGVVGGMHAYKSDINLMDGESMLNRGNYAIDYVNSAGYRYRGEFVDGRILHATGYIDKSGKEDKEGFVFQSSGMEDFKESFTVTMNYTSEETGKIGDLWITEWGVRVRSVPVYADQTSVTLEVKPSKEVTEIALTLHEGKTIDVSTLIYKRPA